jgi:large subunit ribosomal protein L5
MGEVQQEIGRNSVMATVPRMKTYYQDTVRPALVKHFNYPNVMMAPRLEKIVINIGVGEASQNPKLLESVSAELGQITGMKPAIARAKKSISNFKLRQGMPIGCRVTLRRNYMYEFLDRLINIAIPRIRDFRGVSDRSFDGHGNYSLGIREQIIFPEIDYDKIEKIRGMNITFVTTAKTDEEAMELLKGFGFPFRRKAETETATV